MSNEIINKINGFRSRFPNLFGKAREDYILNAVVAECLFFKDPANVFDENTAKKIIVDGKCDGGVDCILTDLDSDYDDMIFIQSKYYQNITLEQIKIALAKMFGAYKNLLENKNNYFRDELVEQYSEVKANMQDSAKTIFYFCTSAPRNGIKTKTITSYFKSLIGDNQISLEVLFSDELSEKIIEFNSLKRTVDIGKIKIDKSNNVLIFKQDLNSDVEDAVIVNGSANSIKQLYSLHHLALFDQNLRYFVKSANIDRDINSSIDKSNSKFWYKNNGITIICDDFELSGDVLKMNKFSIINGGQTTTLIGKNDSINEENDFYLPIKIIKSQGDTNTLKQQFVFDIAIATNSQKAIKPSDLKANRPEQISFFEELKNVKIFYKTKRGQEIPNDYKSKTRNCDLPKVTKLALAGIFLMPGTSRSNPGIVYKDDQPFYELIFKKHADKCAKSIRDLLYIDNYFSTFKTEFAKNTKAKNRIDFANNSRTLCQAFCGFLAKYQNGFFSEEDINFISNVNLNIEENVKKMKKILSDASQISGIFNKESWENNKDALDEKLYKIFTFLCKIGTNTYTTSLSEENKTETNWLKLDVSFYKILSTQMDDILEEINERADIYKIFIKE